MKRPAKSLALKIAQLLEDHSDSEIDAALRLLSRYGRGDGLFEYLARESTEAASTGERATRKSRPKKPMEETNSRILSKLEKLDPEKFQILSEFDKLVRSGQVLHSNLALREFGSNISKDFKAGKSRKDSIVSVMAALSERSLDDIVSLIEQATATAESSEGGYQRLANFLIKGR